jgi:hypothetical protein
MRTTKDMIQLREKLDQVSKILAKAQSLQSLSLVWTETTRKWDPFGIYDEREWTSKNGQIVRVIQGHIERMLQPLGSLTPACTIQKGEQVVSVTPACYMQGNHNYPSCQAIDHGLKCSGHFRVTAMEMAFSNAINLLVAGRMPSI